MWKCLMSGYGGRKDGNGGRKDRCCDRGMCRVCGGESGYGGESGRDGSSRCGVEFRALWSTWVTIGLLVHLDQILLQ